MQEEEARSAQKLRRDGAILVRSRDAFIEQLKIEIGEKERILVIASERARSLRALSQNVLSGRLVQWYSDFSSNPSLASACQAAALASKFQPSVIIGLGGGSAMDVAKAARVLPPSIATALEMARSSLSPRQTSDLGSVPRLIAIPTLSGSGAEVTQFATLFHDGRKVSVDDAGVRPDIAVIDPSLADTAPHLATSAAILDAMCHAVESAWSIPATAVSRGHSERGLKNLAAVRWKTDGAYTLEDRYLMAAGAVSAGLAINLTRTTAAHAAAYMLTVSYGIPHGVACALNMQWVAKANVTATVMAPDVVAVVKRSLGMTMTDLPEYFGDQLSSAGWPTRLRDYGVSRTELRVTASDATNQARLRNNPVDLSATDVERGLSAIF